MLKMKNHDSYWWCSSTDSEEKLNNKLNSGYIILYSEEHHGYKSYVLAKDNLSVWEYWMILDELGIPYPFNTLVNYIGLTDF